MAIFKNFYVVRKNYNYEQIRENRLDSVIHEMIIV